jgi:hypothetical protein
MLLESLISLDWLNGSAAIQIEYSTPKVIGDQIGSGER